MNKHFFIVIAILAAVGYGIWSLVSEPDYTIAVVSRERKASDVELHRKKLEADPANPALIADLAQAYLVEAKVTGDQKMYELAKETADRVLQIDSPHRAHALMIHAEVALARNQAMVAYDTAEMANTFAPEDSDVTSVRVRANLAYGRYEEAERLATSLQVKRPSSESIRLRGIARESIGNFEGAERDLIAAIGLEEKADLPNAIENRVALTKFYLARGDLDRAKRVLAAALKVSNEARLLGLQGEIEFKDGKFDKAKSAYDSAFQKDHDPQYLIGQATTEKARGREAEFRTLIDLAVDALKAEVANSRAPRKMLFARALVLSAKPGEVELAARLVKEEMASGVKSPEVLELRELAE